MTDGLIEKVAEAIFLTEGRSKDVAWKDADSVLVLFPGKERVSDYYRGVARAAIEAMRQPTEAMITASRQALGKHIRSLPAEERTEAKGYVGGFRVHDESLKARIRYSAMIDEALK